MQHEDDSELRPSSNLHGHNTLPTAIAVPTQPQYPHQDLTRQIIGGFYSVYNELGFGYVESIYEAALHIALTQDDLTVTRQAPITVWFRGHRVGQFRADLVVEDAVILELKARRQLEPAFEAQLLNLLRGTRLEIGLLLNFGPKPEIKRLVFSNARKRSVGASNDEEA